MLQFITMNVQVRRTSKQWKRRPEGTRNISLLLNATARLRPLPDSAAYARLRAPALSSQAIYILANGCPYPAPLTAFYLVYIISLFALFMNFYLKRWTSSSSGRRAAQKAKEL
jgi:hypothetical protein